MVDDRVPGIPAPEAARRQVADMEKDPSAYFKRARQEAARLADQQIDEELSARVAGETWKIVEVDQKHESKLEPKALNYLNIKGWQKRAARDRLRLRQEKLKRAKSIGRNQTLEAKAYDGENQIVVVVKGLLSADDIKEMRFKVQDNSDYTVHVRHDSAVKRDAKHVAVDHGEKA
jgi:hypothetical protein